jgi:hypothetical protein
VKNYGEFSTTVSCNFLKKETGIAFPDEDLVVRTTQNTFADDWRRLRGGTTHFPTVDFIGGPNSLHPMQI